MNRVGIVEKAEQVKDLGSFAGDCKEQEHDSSLEEEEFWDFDSDDDACSYCRTCQLRRRLEKRLAAKKMLHQLEANEDHIRRVKEDNRQPSEDHRSIEDLLRFIGEDSGGEKQKSKGGVAGSKKSNSRSNKKKGRKKQSYKSMGGEMSKSSKSSEQMHGCNGIEDEESGNSGGSWLSKTSHKAFVETSSMPKRASNHPQGNKLFSRQKPFLTSR